MFDTLNDTYNLKNIHLNGRPMEGLKGRLMREQPEVRKDPFVPLPTMLTFTLDIQTPTFFYSHQNLDASVIAVHRRLEERLLDFFAHYQHISEQENLVPTVHVQAEGVEEPYLKIEGLFILETLEKIRDTWGDPPYKEGSTWTYSYEARLVTQGNITMHHPQDTTFSVVSKLHKELQAFVESHEKLPDYVILPDELAQALHREIRKYPGHAKDLEKSTGGLVNAYFEGLEIVTVPSSRHDQASKDLADYPIDFGYRGISQG